MKVLSAGHRYELANFEQDLAELNQNVQFIEKVPESEGSTTLKTIMWLNKRTADRKARGVEGKQIK